MSFIIVTQAKIKRFYDNIKNKFALKSHTHSQYLTAHQDISGKADKTSVYTKADVDKKIASAGGVTWDIIYPVGALYISTNNVSPQTIFGGTWERINNNNTTLVFAKSTNAFWGLSNEAFWGNSNNVTIYAWRRTK